MKGVRLSLDRTRLGERSRERKEGERTTDGSVRLDVLDREPSRGRSSLDGWTPAERGGRDGREVCEAREEGKQQGERAGERARSGPKWASESFQERRRARVRTRDWQLGWPFGRPLPEKSRTECRIQESREVRPARLCASNQGGVCRHSAIERSNHITILDQSWLRNRG